MSKEQRKAFQTREEAKKIYEWEAKEVRDEWRRQFVWVVVSSVQIQLLH